MTARPSGAFCSPPSPSPSAIGTMPMIMARAVISTGRKRVKPACKGGRDRIFSFRHLFCGKAHNQNAVCGGNAHAHDRSHQRGYAQSRVRDEQEPGDSGQRRRQCRDHDERIEPRLEIHDDQQVVQHDREHADRRSSPV